METFHCLPSTNSQLFSIVLCPWKLTGTHCNLPSFLTLLDLHQPLWGRTAEHSVQGGESPRTESPRLLLARLRPTGCILYQRPQMLAGLLLNHITPSVFHSLLSLFSSFVSLNSVQLSSITHVFPSETLTDAIFGRHLLSIRQQRHNAIPKPQSFFLLPFTWFSENRRHLYHSTIYEPSLCKAKEVPEWRY